MRKTPIKRDLLIIQTSITLTSILNIPHFFMDSLKRPSLFYSFFLALLLCSNAVQASQNYEDALAKSILFFQGQRSGRLPLSQSQNLRWRSASGLGDGSQARVNLVGGYYDAGDNVKFNFPMAYTTTMLSWSALENSKRLGPQLENVRVAIRWATDYLIKCATATPGVLYVGVGDPNVDHKCWERPEDMDTVRTVYSVSRNKPGSDVAAETAAALAAASLVFRKVDSAYSKLLLRTAKSVFQFAAQYRGSYSDSLGSAVCPFYCSYSGYKDELLWGAAWLLRATKDVSYRNFIDSLGAHDSTDIFSWDDKLAGARVLLARGSLVANDKSYEPFKQQAQDFMCRILPNSPYSTTQYTSGGLMFKLPDNNLQYVASITNLLTTYAKYMQSAKSTFNCGNILVTPKTLINLARKQVDYILGDNPMRMSYMVGYGTNFPKRIHHRGSSLPSKTTHPQSFGCEGGFQPFYYTSNPNPNILVGAIVGGPNNNDFYPDERTDYSHSEPATYINGAIVGPLAFLSGR
ncbi:putative cellulase [Helianthus annuus]|uniref:Endoglucanase n=2 Tax=Helianthus annuus TaxID=4232 RepID=A0A251TZN1_HELAN|nr:putative cellulase [Helianthus annuus]KAJ0527183.1 putative cellulase [Helianthus annuus]KAJ0543585.1 putative cellulase [Helianthus annuus]KAJ0708639.1 putative cellulase [Helianthus annuus]KAJ0889672.1 putative cellulase [Helianthus annuus]